MWRGVFVELRKVKELYIVFCIFWKCFIFEYEYLGYVVGGVCVIVGYKEELRLLLYGNDFEGNYRDILRIVYYCKESLYFFF